MSNNSTAIFNVRILEIYYKFIINLLQFLRSGIYYINYECISLRSNGTTLMILKSLLQRDDELQLRLRAAVEADALLRYSENADSTDDVYQCAFVAAEERKSRFTCASRRRDF